MHIELIGKETDEEEDIVIWSEDMNTGTDRIDIVLKSITKKLSNIVRCVDKNLYY